MPPLTRAYDYRMWATAARIIATPPLLSLALVVIKTVPAEILTPTPTCKSGTFLKSTLCTRVSCHQISRPVSPFRVLCPLVQGVCSCDLTLCLFCVFLPPYIDVQCSHMHMLLTSLWTAGTFLKSPLWLGVSCVCHQYRSLALCLPFVCCTLSFEMSARVI